MQKLPEPPAGELKHLEWEGWGFAGAGDTVVYLVFDPSDTLSAAAKSHSPGKYPGLPCEVVLIAIGRADLDVYRVVFTWRSENLIGHHRAQKASKEEREIYYGETLA